MAIAKIYEMINRENGAFIKCSEKYLIQWVARGFEVESFILEEPTKEVDVIFQASSAKINRTTEAFPFGSYRNIEYPSGNKVTEQEAVNDAIDFYKRKGL